MSTNLITKTHVKNVCYCSYFPPLTRQVILNKITIIINQIQLKQGGGLLSHIQLGTNSKTNS